MLEKYIIMYNSNDPLWAKFIYVTGCIIFAFSVSALCILGIIAQFFRN